MFEQIGQFNWTHIYWGRTL